MAGLSRSPISASIPYFPQLHKEKRPILCTFSQGESKTLQKKREGQASFPPPPHRLSPRRWWRCARTAQTTKGARRPGGAGAAHRYGGAGGRPGGGHCRGQGRAGAVLQCHRALPVPFFCAVLPSGRPGAGGLSGAGAGGADAPTVPGQRQLRGGGGPGVHRRLPRGGAHRPPALPAGTVLQAGGGAGD